MATHYYTVTWDQLHRDARALAWRLMDRGPFRGVVAISRGGLIPAAIIARELDVRLVESVSVSAYAAQGAGTLEDEEHRGEPVVTKPPTAAGDGSGFLIIDDLVDTGATARVVRALLPHAHFACVYAKPAAREVVDTFVTEVSQDTWILFPWDTEPQFVAPLAKRPDRQGGG
ncbi:MAG: xanthine phosphoribosyltransferase [Acetobacteraceae bacterium]|nr:xanthine phosphoribosyltransferase [Acetobacteraceae bacterium]